MWMNRILIRVSSALLFGALMLVAIKVDLNYTMTIPYAILWVAGGLFVCMALFGANDPRHFLRTWFAGTGVGFGLLFYNGFLLEREMRFLAPIDTLLWPIGGYLAGFLTGESCFRLLRRVRAQS